MKKIYIIVGAILLFVFLLFAWIFIIDFSNFAQTLGGGVEDIEVIEKSKFIGTWETPYIENDDRFVGNNGIYTFSSDNTGSIGDLSCTWDITDNRLVIRYYEGILTLTYEYSFKDDDNTLNLTNSNGTLEFSKLLS
jgi:adenine specific DNA methylase Mod